jgi:hypothetical protein
MAMRYARCHVKNPGAPWAQKAIGGPPWKLAIFAKLFASPAGNAYMAANASRRSCSSFVLKQLMFFR